MPVLVIEDVSAAKPVAQALIDSGVSILEVTLRTPAALDVISAIAEVDGAVVAAGTIITPGDLKSAKQAGAMFGVTPGLTHSILEAAIVENFPLLPGVATVSEMMLAIEYGYDFLKFFPAESAGGIPTLRSFSGPFPGIKFCPTGGINPDNACDYLALDNVMCVGGSWLAPADLVKSKQWGRISQLAETAQRSLTDSREKVAV